MLPVIYRFLSAHYIAGTCVRQCEGSGIPQKKPGTDVPGKECSRGSVSQFGLDACNLVGGQPDGLEIADAALLQIAGGEIFHAERGSE